MNFLLEIGTEEIPHWMISSALTQLSKLDLLGAAPLVDATPRRLVVKAGGVPERTPDTEEVLLGPAPPIGFSAGQPMDKATEGWVRKNKLDIKEIYIQETEKGRRWGVTKKISGRLAIDILAETLPPAILGLQWPKTMYWTAKNGPRFIRPIRWIVALLDDHVIPFEIAGVRSGNISRGHRQLGAASIPVTFDSYSPDLLRNFVLLSSHRRRHKIEEEASALGAKIDRDLLETLTFITEYPTAIRGEFDPKFLELPAEVLTTVMRHHQKYFSVESKPGVLAPNFVAVMNTSGDPEGLVKHGNERVLKARFNDARFFWDVDQHKTLASRIEDLKQVTFHAKLGSYFEKMARVKELVHELGGNAFAERAAELCKCDLTTEMVKEFTDLQGVIGGLYAKAQDEPPQVARAIYDHYRPLSMEDSIPESPEGQILSIADKIDTLWEFFRIGLVPSGSKDPFGLRRAAQAIVRILVEGDVAVDLTTILNPALYDFVRDRMGYYFRVVKNLPYDEVESIVALYFPLDRARQYAIELSGEDLRDYRDIFRSHFKSRNYSSDEVEAVLAAGFDNMKDVEECLKAIHEVRTTEDFEAIAASSKRIKKILKQASFTGAGIAILESSFQEGPERDLYRSYARVVLAARKHLPAREFRAFFQTIADTRSSVDSFFDHVMVMDNDRATRDRRLELLYRIDMQFNAVADFSKIVTAGEQK